MTLKQTIKRVWHFIWEDDSIWSWLVNLVLAFIIIKFIVYPGLGLLLGTSFPVVAVVSGSMEHDGSFEEWWQSPAYCGSFCSQEEWYVSYEITEEEFQKFPFKNGFNKGDIMVLQGIEPKNIKSGDVIVFMSREGPEPIIHRVIVITTDESTTNESTEFVYQTKGDHNSDSGDIDMEIAENAVIGKAVFRIPLLGWIKILFVEFITLFR